ncbi:WD40 repeat domain-containing protein [Thermomonospora catenispora]|uniref:WD40 repeat domain-containing protein n=1 Tax=Thermomonospora catenispora TaxID=2493090 RepID=UPI0030C83DDB
MAGSFNRVRHGWFPRVLPRPSAPVRGTPPRRRRRLRLAPAPLRLEGHRHRVISAAFSPDGTALATVSRDKAVKLWQTEA